MDVKKTDAIEDLEGNTDSDEPGKKKKKQTDKDGKTGKEPEDLPTEELDFETGLPPMKW
jgi:hypothetical protein